MLVFVRCAAFCVVVLVFVCVCEPEKSETGLPKCERQWARKIIGFKILQLPQLTRPKLKWAMLTPFELPASSRNKVRLKFWPITSAINGNHKVVAGRRLCGQFLCRLPILTLWTLIVIFILYKSTSNTNPFDEVKQQDSSDNNNINNNNNQENKRDQTQWNAQSGPEINYASTQSQLLIRRSSDKLNDEQNPTSTLSLSDETKTTTTATLIRQHVITEKSDTKKKSGEDIVRRSKVFILIVQQDEDPRTQSQANYLSYNVNQQELDLSKPSPSAIKRQTHETKRHRLVIPSHIRLLIDILESHRIEYTIDTTRNGLPTNLLTDQHNDDDNKKYSVIVIDDFLRYTKLNHWVRDQLDRHCRTNRIGVITYLTHGDYDNERYNILGSHQHFGSSDKSGSNHELASRSAGTASASLMSSSGGTAAVGSSSGASMTEQFPITFKPFQQNCGNVSADCLVDYQLNDETPILRILKRRRNFIVKGPLSPNLDGSPCVVMSSNHVSYEPVTWAKVRPRDKNSKKSRKKRYTGSGNMYHTPNGTQQRNHNHSNTKINVRKPRRAVVLMNSTMATSGDYAMNSLHAHHTGPEVARNEPHYSLDVGAYDESQALGKEALYDDDMVQESSPKIMQHITSSLLYGYENNEDNDYGGIESQVLCMLDKGLYDGIRRVIFGLTNHHWLNRVLLIDSIEHLSMGRIIRPLDRYIQIDIDDIFVGEKGIRMNQSDVDFLVETQNKFAKKIEGGFKFNLGFSGKYFKHGNENENLGDEQLISRANEFTWFCHFWSHSKAHQFNATEGIANELKKNLQFAQQHNLPIIGYNHDGYEPKQIGDLLPPTYAVAPHHSGGK